MVSLLSNPPLPHPELVEGRGNVLLDPGHLVVRQAHNEGGLTDKGRESFMAQFSYQFYFVGGSDFFLKFRMQI